MDSPRKIINVQKKIALNIAMVGIFTALGVVLGGLNPFAFMSQTVKVFPFAHTINAIVGVLIGPWYGCLTAFLIAIIRFSTNLGSINAFSGGIPGALIVGLVAILITRGNDKYRIYSALFEPIGTVFIGATVSYYFLMNQYESLMWWWGSFAISCIPGMIVGFIVLIVLEKTLNITYLNFN